MKEAYVHMKGENNGLTKTDGESLTKCAGKSR